MTRSGHNDDNAGHETIWQVYIIECRDGSLYTGITSDLARRLLQHNAGRAARYTRGRGPVILRHREGYVTRAQALKREWAIKRLTRTQKQALLHSTADRSPGAGIAELKERRGRKKKRRRLERKTAPRAANSRRHGGGPGTGPLA
ncbi:MAG: GIY-YIG nuclease family protein [Acidiferrobacterales bacterium]